MFWHEFPVFPFILCVMKPCGCSLLLSPGRIPSLAGCHQDFKAYEVPLKPHSAEGLLCLAAGTAWVGLCSPYLARKENPPALLFPCIARALQTALSVICEHPCVLHCPRGEAGWAFLLLSGNVCRALGLQA